ncbi:MAG: response regulator [Bacteroidota bacterium]
MMQLSLRNRIHLTVFLIVATSSLILYFYFSGQQKELITKNFEQSSNTFAVTLALSVQSALEVGDFAAMQRAVRYAKADPEVQFVVILDEDGTAIAAYPDSLIDAQQREKRVGNAAITEASFDTADLTGRVRVGRTTSYFEDELRNAQGFAVLISLSSLLLGVAGAFWLARSIAVPVLKIQEAAMWLGQGDLASRVHVETGGEIGKLALAFNQMADDIQRYLDAAQEATRAKGEFLASMSHEIRTPMNGVIGMTSLLTQTALDEEQREYVETIRNSGDSLLTIINDILDFSKIEAGQLELEEHSFEIRTCIEDAIDVLALKASNKGLELASLIMPDVPHRVVGDSTRLRQIIVNLVGNGIKFTEQGEVTVTVELQESVSVDHIKLHLVVQDTGIGIPEEKKNRLFRSFSQVDSSTTRKYGGTGLGLAISKRLTTLMQGEIWVESEPGQGAAFHVTLMVKPDGTQLGESAPQLLEGKRVLVVDDNATNRRILSLQLAAWGMDVSLAASGPEALKCRQKAAVAGYPPFDLYLLDYQMPVMDGVSLARLLNRDVASQTPVLMLSSLGTRIELLTNASFVSLHKPAREQHLQQALMRLLSTQTVPAAPPEIALPEIQAFSILLAEDHMINQKVVVRFLEELGLQADVVANGREAVHAVSARMYDVILMDTRMPEMDGFSAAQWMRSNLPAAEQPYIIVMSVEEGLSTHQEETNDVDPEVMGGAAIDAQISKPVKISELKQALHHFQLLSQGLKVEAEK